MSRLKRWGSHLPVLMRVVAATEGPIVELGCGLASTPVLHWMCSDPERELVSYEHNEKWFDSLRKFQAPWHKMIFVEDWDEVDLSYPYTVALVDHAPAGHRYRELQRLLHVDYVIVHDAGRGGSVYGYDKVAGLYDYVSIYRKATPRTAVLSNKHDTSEFCK